MHKIFIMYDHSNNGSSWSGKASFSPLNIPDRNMAVPILFDESKMFLTIFNGYHYFKNTYRQDADDQCLNSYAFYM